MHCASLLHASIYRTTLKPFAPDIEIVAHAAAEPAQLTVLIYEPSLVEKAHVQEPGSQGTDSPNVIQLPVERTCEHPLFVMLQGDARVQASWPV